MLEVAWLTLPPVLLARHDTTTSAGLSNATLRNESLLLTSPNLTSAPLKSCKAYGRSEQASHLVHLADLKGEKHVKTHLLNPMLFIQIQEM